MTIELSMPTEELARKLTGEVPYERRLMGIKMSAMGGGNPATLYSLPQAARFIHVGNYEDIALATRGATVGYIDSRILASWIEEVLGDRELADGVRDTVAGGEAYGNIAMDIKALLERRLAQAHEVLNPPEPAEDTAEEAEFAQG